MAAGLAGGSCLCRGPGRGAGIPRRPAGLVSGERRGCHGECSQSFAFHSEFHGRVLRGIGDDFKCRPCSCGVGGGRGGGNGRGTGRIPGELPLSTTPGGEEPRCGARQAL